MAHIGTELAQNRTPNKIASSIISMQTPSIGWQKLQDVYYHLIACYLDMNWDISNLYSQFRVAVSTHSTVMALATKLATYPNIIDVYSLSGTKLWSVVYNSHASDHIVDFAFRNEDLCVVLSNNKFRYYLDFKGTFNEYSYIDKRTELINMSSSSTTKTDSPSGHFITNLENLQQEQVFRVLQLKIMGNFLVLLLDDRLLVTNLETFKNYEISVPNWSLEKIHCLTDASSDENLLALFISYDKTVYVLNVDFTSNSFELIDQSLTDGPFSVVSASPSRQLIALHNKEVSKIFVINNLFDQVLLEYDTSNESGTPFQVEWCGNDAIILSLRDEIKLIGPAQRSVSFFYDIMDDIGDDYVDYGKSASIPILKTQPDGVTIISSDRVEFLGRVADSSVKLFEIGASDPGSILVDCFEKLSAHPSKADSNISMLKGEDVLEPAIETCLDAALREFDPIWQKRILKAVSFGKAYFEGYIFDSDRYVQVVNTLKVLNQLRAPELGLFLTFSEVEFIGWKKLIDMLLRRDQHAMALRITELVNKKDLDNLVYIHWCCSKIKKELNMSDEDLLTLIENKLSTSSKGADGNVVPIEQISKVALEEGRNNLSKWIIEKDPSPYNRVKQFLAIGEPEVALMKAFETCDSDLCKLILLHLFDTLSLSQFFKILDQNEQNSWTKRPLKDRAGILNINGDLIGNFWTQTIGKDNLTLFEQYHKQEDKRFELCIHRLRQFIAGANVDHEYYESYKLKLTKAMHRTIDNRLRKIFEKELDILDLRRKLTEIYQTDFFTTKTLVDVVVKLIQMNQLKQANRVCKEFNVDIEKLWYITVDSCCKSRDFDKLMKFIRAHSDTTTDTGLKSPIGFGAIIETCLAYSAPKQYTSVLINNLQNVHYTRKVELYLKNDDIVLAAQEASKNRDTEYLKHIYERAEGNEALENAVKRFMRETR